MSGFAFGEFDGFQKQSAHCFPPEKRNIAFRVKMDFYGDVFMALLEESFMGRLTGDVEQSEERSFVFNSDERRWHTIIAQSLPVSFKIIAKVLGKKQSQIEDVAEALKVLGFVGYHERDWEWDDNYNRQKIVRSMWLSPAFQELVIMKHNRKEIENKVRELLYANKRLLAR